MSRAVVDLSHPITDGMVTPTPTVSMSPGSGERLLDVPFVRP